MAQVPVKLPPPGDSGDLVTDLVKWARECLVVPPGHPLAGEPMAIPDFAERFLRDAMAPGIREALLTVGRKNAKSAVLACLLLAHLAGPLARQGWRGAVCSINKEKANELKRQMEEIAGASGLMGLRFLRSPAPGRVEAAAGTLDILSADRSAGHASGFDLVVCDELGLLVERDRGLLSGLKSSTSARDGRMICISIHGDGPFVPEFLARASDPAVTVHAYIPPAEADPTDPATWVAGNPGLAAGIKSRSYMIDRARLAATNPTDLAYFRAEDCNIPGNPGTEMIVSPAEWNALDNGAPRDGRCYLGLDAGGSRSMTAAVAIWPESGRMECYGAFPVTDDFDLAARGRADAVGLRYQTLHETGQLWTYAGRLTTPVVPFLQDVRERLDGQEVVAVGADRFRKSEVLDYLADAGLNWPVVWRGQGASATADGSADVRAFQRAVLDRWLRPTRPNLLMVHAIAESMIRRDASGNPALDKSRQAGRIDPLSAAVIACGLAERERMKPRHGYRSGLIG